MKQTARTSILLAGVLAFSCAAPPSSESEKVDPSFQKYVLSAVPADVPNPTFVDFGGKLHLVGYEISPATMAKPGTKVSVKLYWRSVKKVPLGYRLATRLTAPDGTVTAFDDVGPLRETTESDRGPVPRFPPSSWTPGMIYIDEQTLTVPADTTAPVLYLTVSVAQPSYEEKDGKLEKVTEFKLGVLSGASDGKEGALLARLATGARRGDKAKDKDGRRRPTLRPGADRRPGMPVGREPAGRVPGSLRENPQ